jgi:hemolysin D
MQSCLLSPDFPVTPEQVQLFQQRLTSQYSEYLSRKGALENEVLEHQAEHKSVEERIAQLKETIPLITERAAAMEKMLSSGVVPRVQWLEVEEQRIGQVKELDVQKSNLNRLQAGVGAAQQQLNALGSQVQSQWLAELNDTENKINAIKQELVKAEQRQTLQHLVAPVAGTVQQLAMHTVGGVVTPAQQLMLIVPEENAIEVEAWVQNRDIGFVEKGQVAEIKIETFPYTKYGVINGEIQNVSNDAVPNEQLGLIYIARVLMEKTTMQVNGKIVNLSPGMAVTVEVKIGKRRIIEYVLSPLLRYKEESIQER